MYAEKPAAGIRGWGGEVEGDVCERAEKSKSLGWHFPFIGDPLIPVRQQFRV